MLGLAGIFLLSLTAQEPARLQGRLVGPDGPLAHRNFVVQVFSMRSGKPDDRTVITDAEGRFTFQFDPRLSSGLFLDLRPLGFREAVQFSKPRAGDHVDLGDLGPPARLRGRLVDAVGDVVPLEAGAASKQSYFFTLERTPLGERKQVKVFTPHGPMATKEIDGEFLVEGLLPGPASIRQHREAPVEVMLEGGHETFIEIPFRGQGVSVDLDFAWGRIRIDPTTVHVTDPIGRRVPHSSAWGRRIEFDGLQGGPFVVTLEDPRFVVIAPQTVELRGSVTLFLTPEASVELDVRAPTGVPVTEWNAWVFAEDGEYESREGRVPMLASPPAELVVLAQGYPPWAAPWTGQEVGDALRIDLVAGATRTVEVTWCDGLPVPGAFVYFMQSPARLKYEVEGGPTGESGRCEVSGISARPGVLEVDLGGGCTVSRSVARPLAEEGPMRFEIEGGWVDLEIVVPDGVESRRSVLVSGIGPDGAVPDRLVARDGRGRYRYGPLEPGRWELAVTIQIRGAEWTGRGDTLVPGEEGQSLILEPLR